MKRLIAIGSVCLSVGFALALASAEDGMSMRESTTTTTTTTSNDADANSPVVSQETRTSKTCTNEKGVTFQSGQKGYQTCVRDFEKDRPSQATTEKEKSTASS